MKCAHFALLGCLATCSAASAQEQNETQRNAPTRRPTPVRPDPPPAGKSVRLSFVIADLAELLEAPTAAKILELVNAGKTLNSARIMMTAIDENPSFLQFGEHLPAGGSRSVSSFGRPTTTSSDRGGFVAVQSEKVGTVLQATTRIEDDGSIILQVFLERNSEAARPRGDDKSDAVVKASSPAAFSLQTTVRTTAGQPQIIGSCCSGAGKQAVETWVVLTASESGSGAKK